MPAKNETLYCSGPCKGGQIQGTKCREYDERAEYAAFLEEYPEPKYKNCYANYRRFQNRKAVALAKKGFNLQKHKEITQFNHFSSVLKEGETMSKFFGHGPSNADTDCPALIYSASSVTMSGIAEICVYLTQLETANHERTAEPNRRS